MIFLQKKDFFDFLKINNIQGSLLGIDYGSKKIGLAITNSNRSYALQLNEISFELNDNNTLFQFTENDLMEFKCNKNQIKYFSNAWRELFDNLMNIIHDKNIAGCVIGLPIKNNSQMINIQYHVELFAVCFNYFIYQYQLKNINFEKIQLELELSGIKFSFNENDIYDNDTLVNRIDKFPILLQDERYTTRNVFIDIQEQKKQFLYHRKLINHKFKANFKRYDEEENKFFKDKKKNKINNLKKFDKFQKNAILKNKNVNAAINILNAAIES